MTPSQIVDFARKMTGATDDEVTDTDIYRYLNFSYLKLCQSIALIDKNYFMEKWTTDTAANVSEYSLLDATQAPPSSGQIKIQNVDIKYNETDTYRTTARELGRNVLEQPQERYAENQPESEPFYVVNKNAIIIFPTPKTPVTGGLSIRVSDRQYDLTSAMVEADVKIEREYHDVIGFGVIPFVYRQRQQYELVANAEQEFTIKKDMMLKYMKTRALKPLIGLQTNLYGYIY